MNKVIYLKQEKIVLNVEKLPSNKSSFIELSDARFDGVEHLVSPLNCTYNESAGEISFEPTESEEVKLMKLKEGRDLALASNKVEIRSGEFVNARYEDKPNLEAIYSALSDGASYEFYNSGDFITLSKEEIATVLQQGQIQLEAIWSQFKADVKAL